MGGVPSVRHFRVPVATVLRLLAVGLSEHEIVAEYPDPGTEDIRERLPFAASSVDSGNYRSRARREISHRQRPAATPGAVG